MKYFLIALAILTYATILVRNHKRQGVILGNMEKVAGELRQELRTERDSD